MFWSLYGVQVVVGLVLVVVAFVLLRAVGRMARFAGVLAVGAAAGMGAAWGLMRLGLAGRWAWWAAVGVALVALMLGMRVRQGE